MTARNEAVDIIWLKDYLKLTPQRPTWAAVTDLIIDAVAPENTNKEARINTFLQTWHPPTRGRRATKLDNGTMRMMKVARKYNTDLAAVRLSANLQALLPAWYHLAADPRPMTSITAKCLLNHHRVSKVADLVQVSARVQNPERHPMHQPNLLCICRGCVRDRIDGCRHPHACAEEARERLNLIAPKLNPLRTDEHGNLSLTRRRKAANALAKERQDAITFDPSLTAKDDLAECFRIFVNPERISNRPAERTRTREYALREEELWAYTDGACMNNGKENVYCGSGVWIGQNHPWNRALKVPGNAQSNQVGEIAAVIAAVNAVPPSWPLRIITDSRYVIEGLTEHLPAWEDRGWIGIENAKLFKKAAFLLRKRTAPTTLKWVKGHEGDQGNEESNKLAKEGASKEIPDILDLEVPINFDLQGAKLSTLTQAIAYRGIIGEEKPTHKQTMKDNLQRVRDAIAEYNGTLETDETIWRSTQNPTLRIKFRQFLYKGIYATQKVGGFWANVRNHENRQFCTTCQGIESMEHILLTCNEPAVNIIWNHARNLWPHPNTPLPEISMGTILGIGCIRAHTNEQAERAPNQGNEQNHRQRHSAGKTRLLQIIISELAYLIWVLRCERVIQGKRYNQNEITSRWRWAMNRRLVEDKITATQIKRTKQAIWLVRDTWEDALKTEGDLEEQWIHDTEVLVGRRQRV